MPLRPATAEDVALMLSWRNQQINREMSTRQHVIGREEHREWWERTSHDPSRLVLIFESDGRSLGVVNFSDLDQATRSASWGFYLDHETAAAEGLTFLAWVQVMREALDYAFDDLDLDALEGEVLAVNEAVRAMNRRFGFVEGAPEQRISDGGDVVVHPIRLRREDRPPSRHARD